MILLILSSKFYLIKHADRRTISYVLQLVRLIYKDLELVLELASCLYLKHTLFDFFIGHKETDPKKETQCSQKALPT